MRGVSVGLVPYLTICLPRGLHLLMENPPHPGSLCLTASLCPPGLWLSSPVIAQGFVLCTLADTFMPSLPHHPAQSQTHTQWAAFPGFISDLSSCSPCLAQDSLSTHLATSWYRQWWNSLPAPTPLTLPSSLSQLLVQPETETNLRSEQSDIISYAPLSYITTENLLLQRVPNPACWSPKGTEFCRWHLESNAYFS